MDAPTPDVPADLGDAALAAIPRRYNFAEDVLTRNLIAGRAGKAAYIDPRGTWTYGQLTERVAQFGKVLRGLGIAREQRILICLTDTIDWPTYPNFPVCLAIIVMAGVMIRKVWAATNTPGISGWILGM